MEGILKTTISAIPIALILSMIVSTIFMIILWVFSAIPKIGPKIRDQYFTILQYASIVIGLGALSFGVSLAKTE